MSSDFSVKFTRAYLATELTCEGEAYKLLLGVDVMPYPQKFDIVGVHYTFDQWQTTHKALADWVGEHPYKRREEGPAIKRRHDDSQFLVEIPLGTEPLDPEDKVWFAVYATRPATHSWEPTMTWDNNNGWNYEVTLDSLSQREP
jgi:hypothetical protein